jgi:DNA-binding Lrp family transcriptional regulator
MDLNDINLITVLEQNKSISKAADYLGISQPALSKLLKKLEAELGTKLFMRLPRGIKITREGEIYLHSFKKMVQNLKFAESQIAALNSEFSEKIDVSVHPILGKYIIPKIEAELSLFPEIDVNYIFQNSRDGIEQVLAGEMDLAIVADANDYPDLVKRTLWKEYIGLYSKDGQVKDTVLYNSKMIFANKHLRSIEFSRARAIDDYSIIYSILKRSDYMVLLPNPIVKEIDRVKLITKFKPTMNISMVYRSDKIKTKGFMKLVSTLKKYAKA